MPAYLALAGIWGLSFLFIRVADRGFSPLDVALGRVVLGAAVVGAITLLRRERLPAGVCTWLCLAVAALLMNAVPFTLVAYGEQRVSSVDAGLWNAATPLLAMPATMWLIPAERPRRGRIVGLAVGFAGVAVLLGTAPSPHRGSLAGQALCLGAACSYGLGFPFSRRFLAGTGLTPVALAAGQLACAVVELVVIALPVSAAPADPPLAAVLSLLALGAAGTGLAYILNFTVVREAGATIASTVTYLIPICSTAAGVLLLGERLTVGAVVGACVILTGAALIQRRATSGTRPRSCAPTPREPVRAAKSPRGAGQISGNPGEASSSGGTGPLGARLSPVPVETAGPQSERCDMSVTDQLLANNAVYAQGFESQHPMPPALGLAVVACMDARLNVYDILGLAEGQAHVIRNAGGVVTDDEIRSLAISQRLLGTREIILIHHTDCGMLTFTDDQFKAGIEADTGIRPPWAAESFSDLDADVRQSIARIKANPFVPHKDQLRGFVFDVRTGLLREVS